MLNQTNTRRRLQMQFSQGLIQSQEDERKRIARELHDSISQQLTLIKKKAQNTNQEEITTLTHNTLEEVRAISRGLYPPLLKQLGLTESIEQLILDVDEQTNLFVSGDVDPIDAYFNETHTLNCYRFIQECINNTLKHTNAKALSVSVLKFNHSITISIQDNGKGFDASNAKKQNSLGLKTIYERIRILNGELTIDSKPNKGTTITAKLPLNNGKHLNIIVADDHPMLLKGLTEELTTNGYNVIATAQNGAIALEHITTLNPDIAILDIEMPLLTGFEVINKCEDKALKTKFIVLTSHKESRFVYKAKNLNISGYLLKDEPFTELQNCLNAIKNGDTYFSSKFNAVFDNEVSPELEKIKFLSPSERTIVRLIAKGNTSRDISESLLISIRT